MKRLFGFLAIAVLITSVSFGVNANAASVDNYVIDSLGVKLELGRDKENRSILKTTETINATFPPDQNHGLERSFVKNYDDHSTSLKVISVTDESGNNLPYHWASSSSDVMRIGDKDVFVSGKKTYVITYTQRDVTKHYKDTDSDEFYWDAVGTDWRVPISSVSINLELKDNLEQSVKSDMYCYAGQYGSSDACSSNYGLSASQGNLTPGSGVTIALGFNSGTFAGYEKTFTEKVFEIWNVIQYLTMPVFVATWFIIRKIRKNASSRKKELGTIVPEYIPPSDASVTTSATYMDLVGSPLKGSAFTAQILDLAVRHYLVIREDRQKTFFSSAKYSIEVKKDLSDLRPEEREIIDDMLGREAREGDVIALKSLADDLGYQSRIRDDRRKVQDLIDGNYGLMTTSGSFRSKFKKIGIFFVVLSVLLLAPLAMILSIFVFVWSRQKIASDKGLALNRYLLGLKEYISVAETDRINMLQSPEAVSKIGEVTGDNKKILTLYERVLPYAVLFNKEREWSKQMGQYYEQSNAQPGWYSGVGVFNAMAFSEGVSSVASSVNSYSSSTGGSTGGGSVGGGGGGGGGGGW